MENKHNEHDKNREKKMENHDEKMAKDATSCGTKHSGKDSCSTNKEECKSDEPKGSCSTKSGEKKQGCC